MVVLDMVTNENTKVNMQNPNGCLCLFCKTELLNCKHQCIYCYWK